MYMRLEPRQFGRPSHTHLSHTQVIPIIKRFFLPALLNDLTPTAERIGSMPEGV